MVLSGVDEDIKERGTCRLPISLPSQAAKGQRPISLQHPKSERRNPRLILPFTVGPFLRIWLWEAGKFATHDARKRQPVESDAPRDFRDPGDPLDLASPHSVYRRTLLPTCPVGTLRLASGFFKMPLSSYSAPLTCEEIRPESRSDTEINAELTTWSFDLYAQLPRRGQDRAGFFTRRQRVRNAET